MDYEDVAAGAQYLGVDNKGSLDDLKKAAQDIKKSVTVEDTL